MSKSKSSLDCDFDFESTYKNGYSGIGSDYNFDSTCTDFYPNINPKFPIINETNFNNTSNVNDFSDLNNFTNNSNDNTDKNNITTLFSLNKDRKEEIEELIKFYSIQQNSINMLNKSINKFQETINRLEEQIIKLKSKLANQDNIIKELQKTSNSSNSSNSSCTNTSDEYNIIDFKNYDFNIWEKITLSETITRYNLKDKVGEYVNFKIICNKLGNPIFCNVLNNTKLKLVFYYSVTEYEIEPFKNYTFTY